MKFTHDRPTSWQVCTACGNELLETDPATRCPRCGGLLEVRHRPPDLSRDELRARFTERRGAGGGRAASGVWRYRDMVLPGAERIVSYPEGNTPLLARDGLDAFADHPGLLFKHEGMNPTGSFKDRGMTVAVTQALRVGARAVACASTGNTAASLATYAALAELPALVLVPADGVALGKLAQTLAAGARTVLVRGDFDACLQLVEAAAPRLGLALLNSINPWRVEGQKTIVLEMLEQLGWDAPDWIVLPAGNLGNTAAFGKALHEAHAWGLIRRVPRLAAVQAAGAAPFAAAFADDFRTHPVVRAETVATAIRIGAPASWDRGVAAIRETRGVVLSVTDDEILEAKAALDRHAAAAEPASAAALAGTRRLVRQKLIVPGERVVCVLTGHVLKDPGILLDYHQRREPPPAGANRPVEIAPELSALERILGR